MSLLRHPILLLKIECYVTFAPPCTVVKTSIVKGLLYHPVLLLKHRLSYDFCATLYLC